MTSEVNDLLLTITVTCAHMLVKACTHSTKHVDSVHRCMHALPNTSCKDVLTLKLGTQTDTSSKLLTPELLSKVSSKSDFSLRSCLTIDGETDLRMQLRWKSSAAAQFIFR